MKENKGIVFNIQKYSVHDGQGIRTIIFLKGCPLRCQWCSNPESQELLPEVMISKALCCHCGSCARACARKAIGEDLVSWDRKRCAMTGRCAAVCPTGARVIAGTYMAVEEVRKAALQDSIFYRTSRGGVTFSGGEPLVQSDFVEAAAKSLKKDYVRLAIETTGYASWENAGPVFNLMDEILYDIKHMDDSVHRELTGVGNKRILENARKAAALQADFIIRVPVIGGKNNDEHNIYQTGMFAKEIGAKEVNLLPYHRFGEGKYEKVGRNYSCDAYTPDEKEMNHLQNVIENLGVHCKIGG